LKEKLEFIFGAIKKISFLLLLFVILSSPLFSLEFANFSVKGYEGKGELEFIQPEDLVLGPKGEIIVADYKNNRIQILKSDGAFERFIVLNDKTPGLASFISSISSSKSFDDSLPPGKKSPKPENPADRLKLDKPVGLALDDTGKLYVSCSGIHQILTFQFKDGALLGVIGKQGRTQGLLDIPMDIDVRNDGYLAVADSGNRRVQIFDPEGKFVREIHYKEETKKKELRSIAPRGVFWLASGDLVVSYPLFHQIVCWDLKGNLLWRYGSFGHGKGELNEPSYIVKGPGNNLLLSDSRNHRIVEITSGGIFVKNYPIGRGTAPGRLLWPRGMFLTDDDTLIVSDQGNNRVHFLKPCKAAIILREARALAQNDSWDQAFPKIEHALNLQPDDQDARNLMVNALHFFGDRSFQKNDFEKAEEFFRRILQYNPNDPNVQKKLDSIFWASNKDLIINCLLGIAAVILGLLVFWIIKTTFNRLVFGHP